MAQGTTSSKHLIWFILLVILGAGVLGAAYFLVTDDHSRPPDFLGERSKSTSNQNEVDVEIPIHPPVDSDPPPKLQRRDASEDPKVVRTPTGHGSRRVEGVLSDSDTGEPIPFYRVYYVATDSGLDVREIAHRTPTKGQIVRNSSGRFTIDGLDQPRYDFVFANPNYDDTFLPEVAVPASGLKVTLSRGAYLTGRVLDDTGRSIQGIKIFMKRTQAFDDKPNPTKRIDETNTTGRFIFPKLPSGMYTLTIGTDATTTTEEITVTGTGRVERDLRLTVNNTLNVFVTDSSGRPIHNARLRIWARGTHKNEMTNKDGVSAVRYLPGGNYSVKVSCRGFKPQDRSVSIAPYGIQDIRFALEPSS